MPRVKVLTASTIDLVRYLWHHHLTRRIGESSVSARVRAHRAHMRANGLRPVQLWVTDVRTAGIAAQAHQQSALVAASHYATDDQAFIGSLSHGDR